MPLCQESQPKSQFSSIQSLCCFQLFVTPWTAAPAHQASLSITNPWSRLKLMSIASVMPPNHLIPCHPLLLPPSIFPSIRAFSNESAICQSGQSIGVSASASALTMYSPRVAVIAFDLPSLGPSPSLNQLLWPGRCLFSLARLGS